MGLATDVGRVLEREVRVYRRLWKTSLFTSTVAPLLSLLALGVVLGGIIDERTTSVDGVPYVDFVTPGLLAGSIMQSAATGSLWPVMAGTTWMRFFHGMVATPISATGVYTGFVVWTALRLTQFAVVFVVCAALLGGVPSWWAVLAVPAAMLTAAAFAAPLTAYSGTQTTDLSFPVIFRVGVIPLYLFSETFFPIEQLPEWMQPGVWISPLWHGVELCRAATTGHVESGGRLLAHVVVLVALAAAGWVWGTRTFTRRLAS